MDILGIPLWLLLLTIAMGLMVYYVWYMSMDLNLFEKMKVDGPGPMPILGNLGHILTSGLYQSQMEMYQTYKDKKVFGIFDSRAPCLVVTDLKLIEQILVRRSEKFPNRQRYVFGDSILHHSLLFLQDSHWQRMRDIVYSTLNDPENFKKILPCIERRNDAMLEYLKEQIEEEEEIDLGDLAFHFNIDSILSTCFGIEANNFHYPEYDFMGTVRKIRLTLWLSKMIHFFFPFLGEVCRFLGICSCEKSVAFFNKLTNSTVFQSKEKDNFTLLQLISKNMRKQRGNNDPTISPNEMFEDVKMVLPGKSFDRDIKGQAFSLTLSSYNTVSSVMAYTIFMLANNPECCQKVQDEIDAIMEQEKSLNLNNIHRLFYLDMCVKETMRMFPSPINIDRVCVEEITIQNVKFPKGIPIFIPAYAIHNDPDIWSNPEEFNPERFSPKYKAKQLPFSYLPFGGGPRKCVGGELALLQIKLGIAALLSALTPSPCYNTVYPVRLSKYSSSAYDGLWVKMDFRS